MARRRIFPKTIRLRRDVETRIFETRVSDEVDEELAFHLEMRIRELVARGMAPDEAREAALRGFGDLTELKDRCRKLAERRERRMTWRAWINEFGQDLRFATRQLRRSPGLALAAVVTLGLGMGATTAVFSVVKGVLLTPLPFPDAQDLVEVRTRYLPPSGFDIDRFPISVPELLDYRAASEAYEVLGVYSLGTRTLTGVGEPLRVPTVFLDRGALEALAVQPEIGRWFTAEEDLPGVAVGLIGHDLWATRFGSDPSIVGKTITLSGNQFLVTGVMPREFAFPTARWQVFENYGIDPDNAGNRAAHGSAGIGRLKDGVTIGQVWAESEGIHAGWAEQYPHNVAHFPIFERLSDNLIGTDVRRALLVLMAAVVVVLLIATTNVANLLLARGEGRLQEVTVRTSLGASRSRIVRQLLTESLVLAVLGALLGLVVGAIGLRALLRIYPEALPRSELIALDGGVLLFTGAVTVASVVLFGLAPALQATWPGGSMAGAHAKTTSSRHRNRFRKALVASEVGLSLVVVLVAGLLARSFQELTSVDPGVEIEGRLVFGITAAGEKYRDAGSAIQLFQRLKAGLETLPGVTSASGVSYLPLSGSTSRNDFMIEGRPIPTGEQPMWSAQWTAVLPDYFRTMGIDVIAGRLLDDGDRHGAEPVVVVSQDVVDQYFEGGDPLGQRVGFSQDTVRWARIVGVVPRTRTQSLDADVIPQIYFAHAQGEDLDHFVDRSMTITVRTAVPPRTLIEPSRALVRGLDPDLPLTRVGTMEDVFDRSVAQPRLLTSLLGTFATIALTLAAVGIYGVVSYSVSKRTKEIGIRLALGADSASLSRLLVREGTLPAVVGVLVAIPAALATSGMVSALLYHTSARDPGIFVTVSLALVLLAGASSYLPARRATRLAPTEALRQE